MTLGGISTAACRSANADTTSGVADFHRFDLHDRRTWAFRQLEHSQTRVNRLWHCSQAQGRLLVDRTAGPAGDWRHFVDTLMPLQRRADFFRDPAEARVQAKETDNWMRLTLTVAIASYLETYVSQLIERAIRSRPGVLIGVPKSVEGVRLLKDNVKLDCQDVVRRCIEGPWSARVAAIEKQFGPGGLKPLIGPLEQLRKTRNRSAHSIGAEPTPGASLHLAYGEAERISPKRVAHSFALASDTAQLLETALGRAWVGEFETLLFFHQKVHPHAHDARANALKKKLGQLGRPSVSKTFARGAVDFFEAC